MSSTSRVALAIALLLTAGTARAAPQIFTYSGFLTDGAGTPVTAASTLEFGFYSTATGGTALATESVSVLPNADGYFSAVIGATVPLPSFASQLYMSVKFQGDASEMDPRIPLTSVPSALSVDWTGVAGFPESTCAAGSFVNYVGPDGVATCAALPAGGTITGVTAGAGLIGSGTSGTVTIAADFTAVQQRVTAACTAGQFMTGVNGDGTVSCSADATGAGDVTGVTAGAGLTGGGTSGDVAIAADLTAVQARVGGACAVGSSIRVVNADGTVVCQPDADSGGTVTSVGGAAPIASSGGTAPVISIAQASGATSGYLSAIDWTAFNNKQGRAVAPTCALGSYLRSIAADGTPTCAADANSGGTVTSVGATAPIVSSGGTAPVLSMPAASGVANGYLSAANFNTFAAKQATLAGSCSSGTSITSISAAGAVTCTPDQAFAFTSGFGLNPSATRAFIGPTATIAVTAGQKVLVTASKALGSTTVGGAGGLNLFICYRASGAVVTPTTVGGGILGNQVAQNTRQIFTVSASVTLSTAGSYEVGLCGDAAAPANWNYNEYGYVTALAVN